MSIFFININIFRHLNLEIELAIPAYNKCKIEENSSTGEGSAL